MIKTILIISIICNVMLAFGFIRKYREASRDHLTELKNFKTFLRKYNRYVQSATKRNIPFAVLFIDIDHFKKINDEYSHLSGNEAIQVVSQRLRNEIKSTDLIARYGGEEFVICLKNCTHSDAVSAANRILHVVSLDPVKLNEQSIRLTVSIGVSSAPKTNAADVLREADQHMYEAKHQGRNRVYAGN